LFRNFKNNQTKKLVFLETVKDYETNNKYYNNFDKLLSYIHKLRTFMKQNFKIVQKTHKVIKSKNFENVLFHYHDILTSNG